ncbi:ion transporter [Lysobacter ciconiae]|uniref:Ion transporter n=1 Tax=Novilysobacter ciconiae TaxID=2781022 RepID=A0A7S6ZSP2_9GAMM|nr:MULTISPECIES: ion transporter [Lysobacter]QOW20030.1 ion transporter [Lysobacter ciconiae]QOY63250.1 ion transporter [Lysobacter sp. H21R4]
MRLLFTPQLNPATESGWRRRWFEIIYHHDTPPARNFDLLLILTILASVIVIMLDSDPWLHIDHAQALYRIEWGFTLVFTAEYLLRLVVVKRPLRYALSMWGVIDLLSILPTYLSFFLPGTQALLVVRILRVLRVFRILKLTRYVEEGSVLTGALWRSRRKIFLFVSVLLTIALIFGALMYVIEGPEYGFSTIPTGMYWAIVTMATVGFGDLAPQTGIGRLITSTLILIGYSIIAVPTGIYTAELATSMRRAKGNERERHDNRGCPVCGLEGHEPDARYCRRCGGALPELMD